MPTRRATAAGRASEAAAGPAAPGADARRSPGASSATAGKPRLTVTIQEEGQAAISGESDDDDSSPSIKAAFHKASVAPRRRGLSTVEKVCFQRALVLSPRGQEKFSTGDGRRSTAFVGDELAGEMASNPESPYNSTLSPGSYRSRHRPTCTGRGQLMEPPVERSGLDVEAEKVALVLGQIFPSTRETGPKNIEVKEKAFPMTPQPPQPGLTRTRGTVLCVNTPSGKSGAVSPAGIMSPKAPAAASAKGGAFYRAAARGSTSGQRDSTGAAGKPAKSPGTAAAAADKGNRESVEDLAVEADLAVPAIEKSRLKRSLAILRKENRIGTDEGSDLPLAHLLKDVDPASRPLFENAILMSKFTAAGGLKRETNGNGFSLRVEVPKAPDTHYGRSWRRTGGMKLLQKVTRKVELMNSLGGDIRVQSGLDKGEEQFSLREFRRRLLKQFGSVHEAFNHIDADMSEELDLAEWEKAMVAAEICNPREAHLMFELLDASNDGVVSITEFQVGVETIAPVSNLETFRKRLLCLGFRTMTQAIKLMESAAGEGTIRQPLPFHDFANALRRVCIFDPAEAHVLHEAIRDPTDEYGRVSISDLAAALGMVSPSFLLEELRERVLMRNCRGQEIWKSLFQWNVRSGVEESERRELQALLDRPHVQALLDKWWTATRYKDIAVADTLLAELKALGVDVQAMRAPGTEIGEFVASTVDQLGFTLPQADKAFRLVDIDGNGELEMAELLSAMNLAMPCVKTEDIRHVIRQRHRSIYSALSAASDMQLVGTSVRSRALDNEVMFTPSELGIFLEPLNMNPKDVLRIFQLVDSRGDGALTLWQFFKGIRIFAPTCVLEGIRLQLLASHGRIATAFYSDVHQERTEPLEFKDVADLLLRLGVRCDDADMGAAFDCLDARNVGTVTVSEMVAAFQNLLPGSRERVNVHESERKAERSVRAELAGVRQNVRELKSNVRKGLEEEPKVAQALAKRLTVNAKSEGRLKSGKAGGGEDEGRMPRLERPSAAELAKVQYEARKMLGKAVSCPELRRRPREQRDADEPPLELPPLDNSKQGASQEATSTGAGEAAKRKPGGGQGRAAFTTGAFDRIRSNVKTLPPHQIQRVQLNFEPLAGYFISASETLEDHMPLLEVRRTRGELHSEIARHVAAARLKVK